jgi:hypothetical protein
MKSFVTIVFFLPLLLSAQEQFKSSNQREWEFYKANPQEVGRHAAMSALAKRPDLAGIQTMNKVVYGFHPYWQNGLEGNYYFSLLTHLAYFSGDVDAATGNFSSTHSWSSAAVVPLAQSFGVKVDFCVVLFSNHATLFGSTSSKNTLIANIMTQINLRNADGCNVDFESVPASQAAPFRDFLKQLGDTLKTHNKELVVELYAVDWNGVFPSSFFSTLNPVVDYYFIMLYDYYYSGSPNAGPSSPLLTTTSTSSYHVLRSIKAYTDLGCPASKIIAGFPNYGNDWPVASSARMASTTGTGVARTYATVKNNYLDTVAVANLFMDATYSTPWFRYQSGGAWRQTWYDDSLSWSKKFDSIKVKNVAGTGMWALGNDGSEPELWGALKTAFAQTANPLHTSFDTFESGTGHFGNAPTYSGSTVGISKLSTAALTNDAANNGAQSLQLILKDSSSISTNWTVRFVSGGGSRANNTQFSNSGYFGFWMKTNSAPAGAQVAITIDDQRSGSSDKTELSTCQTVNNDGAWHLYEWQLPGSGWSSFAGGNGALDSTSLSLDAVMFYAPNGSPDWTLYLDDVSYNASSPLPVELEHFSVSGSRLSALLNWRTASELDNYGFDVERRSASRPASTQAGSRTPEAWTKIGFVQGYGTSNAPHAYVFDDAVPAPGSYAYRLRQIDRNGAFRYSSELNLTIGSAPAAFALGQNFPNPFNPTTAIRFSIPEEAAHELVTLKIYDMLGREVAALVNERKDAGTYSVQWNAAGMPSGTYFYRLRAGALNETKKLSVVK